MQPIISEHHHSENDVEASLVRLFAYQFGATSRLWRNNTGVMKTPAGDMFKFGLGKASADFVGIHTGGAFLAIEVKHTRTWKPYSDRFKDQVRWLEMVASLNGFAAMVHEKNIHQLRGYLMNQPTGRAWGVPA